MADGPSTPLRAGRPVAILGVGVVGPSGTGAAAYWGALQAARQGAATLPGATGGSAACVVGFDPKSFIVPAKVRRLDAASRYAIAAARLAFGDAGSPLPPPQPDRAGAVLGSASAGATPVRDFLEPVLRQGPIGALPMVFPNTVGNAPSSYVAIELGLKGPNHTVSQKEVSGLLAIAQAARYVREGRADLMVAGGADELPETIRGAFDRLGVLQPQSLPFVDGSRGFVMGEGAYVLLLGTGPGGLGVLAGHGVASEGATRERWPRDPETIVGALQEALDDAGVPPCDVDLVVASANGVPEVERVEAAALVKLFHGKLPPVTSVKRLTGEMGSSGAASVAAAALAMRHQALFPAIAGEPARAGLPLAPWRSTVGAQVSVALVCAIGSGGTAAAVVLRRG